MCSFTIPDHVLGGIKVGKVLYNTSFTSNTDNGVTEVQVQFEDLLQSVGALCEGIRSEAHRKHEEKSPVAQPGKSDVWKKTLDDLSVEALRYLLGQEFDQAFDVQQDGGMYSVTVRGASSPDLLTKVECLRQEDVQLSAAEVAMLGDKVEVSADGIEAFIKPLRSQSKAAIFAFDYNAMTKAKHAVGVKVGRVRVTNRGRRRFEGGSTAAQGPGTVPTHQPSDTAPPQSVPSGKTVDLTTKFGVKVSVYKTDITKLPVDAIVNAANERLGHGGGVAAAISRAAGVSLEIEGDNYVRTYGPLKVSEVVATTAGSLPCKQVLHAVGPRWTDYADKGMCRQLLVDTVYNCLLKADSLQYSSVALPSISSGECMFTMPSYYVLKTNCSS